MTAPHASLRRRATRPAAAALLCAVLLGVTAPRALAAWVSAGSPTTGTLTMASIGHTFTAAAPDVGGQTFVTVATAVTLASPSVRYVTLKNTGTVAESLTGTVTATSIATAPSLTVQACTVAWVSGSCSGTTTTPLATQLLTSTPVAITHGALSSGASSYLKVTLSTAVGLTANATVTATATEAVGAGGDRTAG